jgi:ABC-type Fe3+/spermidine/putrescine transport system ATPase subunit
LGTSEELYYNPANYFVADFIGENNFIEGTIMEVNNKLLRISIGQEGQIVTLRNTLDGAKVNQNIYLSIRPEKINIKQNDQRKENCTSVRGKISNKVFLGENFKYIFEVTSEGKPFTLTTISREHDFGNVGDVVDVYLQNEQLKILYKEN